jgi:hypothetical protein
MSYSSFRVPGSDFRVDQGLKPATGGQASTLPSKGRPFRFKAGREKEIRMASADFASPDFRN